MNTTFIIRKGTPDDVPAAWQLIHELAVYEKAGNEVVTTPASMLEDGFGEDALYHFFVAEKDGKIVGIALYFFTYSTWKGRCLYLEDLVVTKAYRRQGVGSLLFDALILEAQKTNSQRMAWQVLDWNEPAIQFYKNIQAALDETWINCKLTTEQINSFIKRNH